MYRIVVGVVGLIVLGVGILAIPYPGPGWAIVFIGLGILATEFAWARRLLAYARERYDKVMDWFHRQHAIVQILGGLVTGADRVRDPVAAGSARLDGRVRRHRMAMAEQPHRRGVLTNRTDSMVAFGAHPHNHP